MALTELAAAVPLDIMPGAGDPANYTLPQQPLHRCMFPGAAAYSTLHRATNPHEFELGGLTFLGTSGQNVDDVFRCVCVCIWVLGSVSGCMQAVLPHFCQAPVYALAPSASHPAPANPQVL
jgi:DNA polymerase II small subunit/DNA polymerase delta subunit B